MQDKLGRDLSYLRISLTDRCNLRCRYCMPEEGVSFVEHSEILRYEEILRLVNIFARLGISRIRLTGGEPLVRQGLAGLVKKIKETEGIDFVGMTTNGILLAENISDLEAAGLDAVNISLDTLNPERYIAITGRDALDRALAGLDAALNSGIKQVKVNCVLVPDMLMGDWIELAQLAKDKAIDVRFIEWMPMVGGKQDDRDCVELLLRELEKNFGPLKALARDQKAGPAKMFTLPGFKGRLGIIAAMSHSFCDQCNRLRLTSTGSLQLCLFYDTALELKALLRGNYSDDYIASAIKDAVRYKPAAHQAVPEKQEPGMYKCGG